MIVSAIGTSVSSRAASASSVLLFEQVKCIEYKACGDSAKLVARIDSLVAAGIDRHFFPGCQVVVWQNGQLVLEKAYGHHTYRQQVPVELHHLYDVASVTKLATGTLAWMYLADVHKVDVFAPFARYYRGFGGKGPGRNETVASVLSHRSGLPAWLPLWQELRLPDGSWDRRWVRADSSRRFALHMADSVWVRRSFARRARQRIVQTPLRPGNAYRYSCLSFLLLPRVVQRLEGQTLDAFVTQRFYAPLQANRLVFRPRERFPLSEIVPTECDSLLRHQCLHGTVHDENAATLGGLSANAGLFASAPHLARVMQMLLDSGQWQGRQLLSDSVVGLFNRVHFAHENNHRGLGFDKPNPQQAYPCAEASAGSFGHMGFTGTMVWADPRDRLVVVFLSNRVHPHRAETGFGSTAFRKQLLQIVYQFARRV